MAKKLLALLLAVLMVAAFQVTAFADESTDALDFTTATEDESGNGWAWDNASQTLTLNGLELDVTWNAQSSGSAIKLPDGAKIVLADGSMNKLSIVNAEGRKVALYGIHGVGSLTITGSGTLGAVGGESVNGSSVGIYTGGNLSITAGANVIATGGNSHGTGTSYSSGVWVGSVLAVDGASLNASSNPGAGTKLSYGAYAVSGFEFSSANVSAAGGKTLISNYSKIKSVGLYTANGYVDMDDSTVELSAGDSDNSYGMYAGSNIDISGGVVKAASGSATACSYGIYSEEDAVSISDDAVVTSTAGNVASNGDAYSAGIQAETGVSISGENTVVQACGGDVSCAEDYATAMSSGIAAVSFEVGNIIISGGIVTAESGSAVATGEDSFIYRGALATDGSISITGGSISTVENGKTDVFSISGTFNKPSSVTISGGKFNVSVAKYVVPELNYELNNNGVYTYYAVFEDAVANAENGAVISDISSQSTGMSCTITVEFGNGRESLKLTQPKGMAYTLPAAPSKSGYAFLGWSDGTTTYDALATVTITKNTTFSAVWVQHPDTPYVPEPEDPSEPVAPVFPFYDVPTSAWYYSAVKYVYDNGLMDGVDTYVFAPNDTLTRAMVWTIIARMSGVDTTGGANWYAKAQEWVVVNGISDGENATAAITRQELVTMLYRYAQIKGYDVSVGENTNILSYIDATSISEYATSAFQWACGSGLTEGDENGALTPLATATRAQAAAIFMRFCEGVK